MKVTAVRAAIALGVGLALGCVAPAPTPPERTGLRVMPGFGSDADGLAEGWRRYAEARIEGPVVGSHRRGSPDPASFEEEVFAREFLARAWRELAARNGWSDRYLEELGRVESEGWLREYTWECLHVLRGLEPAGLAMEDFRDWLETELPGHMVETWVTGHTEDDRVVFHVGEQAHAPYRCARAD